MQDPLKTACLGVETAIAFVRTGRKPQNTPGVDFHDTGTTLVTDAPVPGIASISTACGVAQCWGP